MKIITIARCTLHIFMNHSTIRLFDQHKLMDWSEEMFGLFNPLNCCFSCFLCSFFRNSCWRSGGKNKLHTLFFSLSLSFTLWLAALWSLSTFVVYLNIILYMCMDCELLELKYCLLPTYFMRYYLIFYELHIRIILDSKIVFEFYWIWNMLIQLVEEQWP